MRRYHYRNAIGTWGHPSILLALAQAELRIGNHQAAIELVERVEVSETKDQLSAAIAEVRSELTAAHSGIPATRTSGGAIQ